MGISARSQKSFCVSWRTRRIAPSVPALIPRILLRGPSDDVLKAAAIVFVLATAGPTHARDGSAPAVKPLIYDTGYEIFDVTPMPSLYWVDKDRLLFSGMKAGRGLRPDLRKLYTWDAHTNSTTMYADAKSVCVVDGIVRYTLRVDKEAGKAIVRTGPLGSEKEIEERLPSKEEVFRERPLHSNITCTTHLPRDLVPPPQRFRHVAVLRQGDGYLDIEPGGGVNLLDELRAPKKNLVLYQATGKAIELPLTWDEQFSELDVTFSAYRKAYVLRPRAPRGSPLGMAGPWPRGQSLTVYLLWANGQTVATSIPYAPTEYVTHPQPIKVGWIFGGGDFYRASGLYLFDGVLVSKLAVGLVKETTVSADGCKAAVGIKVDHLEIGTPTVVKIFDFCAGGR